jgi:hypothetical protein
MFLRSLGQKPIGFGYCFTPTDTEAMRAAGHILILTPAIQLMVTGLKIEAYEYERDLSHRLLLHPSRLGFRTRAIRSVMRHEHLACPVIWMLLLLTLTVDLEVPPWRMAVNRSSTPTETLPALIFDFVQCACRPPARRRRHHPKSLKAAACVSVKLSSTTTSHTSYTVWQCFTVFASLVI